ncbi:uncharacterized protein TNCT_529531 [Trichonephila clavata]|uniref:Uncharacterized protein n=1 Tax=Trichonephila clavata TaxID=2740835 RepID=A0A8X6KKW5_TRICU|nr:uncharacterized protein TNCT_529531 [Trichonephila clavata]
MPTICTKVTSFSRRNHRSATAVITHLPSPADQSGINHYTKGTLPSMQVTPHFRSRILQASETPKQFQVGHLQQATYMVSQRGTETVEAAESCRHDVAERAQQRHLIFTRNTGVFEEAAFEYEETLGYESHKLIKIESRNKECRFCSALQWKNEVGGMCCSTGKVPRQASCTSLRTFLL